MDFMLIALWIIVVLLILALVTLFDQFDDMKRRVAENDRQLVRLLQRMSRHG